jgi:phosphoribosylanthranilate isomerase
LKVGVFVDDTPASIESVMRSADLDVVQIYGGAAPRGSRVWKAQRVEAGNPVLDAAILTDGHDNVGHDNVGYDNDGYEAILLDGQSNGVTFDWKIARNWARSGARRVIIAGGLDSSNVAEAIRIADPWGVDASSRLESSPGVKDHEKMRQFIKAAQEAALSATRDAS